MVFLDTESLGLCGPAMLIQYSIGVNPDVIFIEPVTDPEAKPKIKELENLLDDENTILVAYNLPHDISVLYRTFKRKMRLRCSCIDLQIKAKLLHPLAPFSFQSKKTGERAIASLKGIHSSVVAPLAGYLEKELQKRVPKLVTCKSHIHKTDRPDFQNISFSLHTRFKLKTLMAFAGEKVEFITDTDWPLPEGEARHDPHLQPCHLEIFERAKQILEDKNHKFWTYAL